MRQLSGDQVAWPELFLTLHREESVQQLLVLGIPDLFDEFVPSHRPERLKSLRDSRLLRMLFAPLWRMNRVCDAVDAHTILCEPQPPLCRLCSAWCNDLGEPGRTQRPAFHNRVQTLLLYFVKSVEAISSRI